MKRFIYSILFLSLIVLVVGCGNNDVAEDKETGTEPEESTEALELRLGHVTQETHPFHIGAQHFADLVEEKSDGQMTIKIFPSRQLGDDRELLEQTINGSLDMGVISSPLFGGYTPVLDSLQLPFLINDYELELDAITSPEMADILDSLEDSMGVKGLGIFEGGMRHIATNKRAIEKPEDLEKLKLRVVQSDLVESIFSSFNASPTPMAYGEVYSSIQTGVIDGEEINLTSLYSENHYEVIDYVSLTGQFPFPGVSVMNADIFNGLTEEQQNILVEAAQETMPYLIGELIDLDNEAIQILEDEDVAINEIDDIGPFLEKVEHIYDEYKNKDELIKVFVEKVEDMKK